MAREYNRWYLECGEVCAIPVFNKTKTVIGWAIVDSDCVCAFSGFSWTKSAANYLASSMGRTIPTYMHRVLFSAADLRSRDVDHINGDKWDNRMCNLRLVTKRQNQRNRRFQANANPYGRGVCLDKRRGTFMAYCHSPEGKMLNLGTFKSPEHAREAARNGRIANGYLNVEDWA